MKPNFFVIGAAKSATTTLCILLGQHPDVFMCDPKEPGFFSNLELYTERRQWYERLFENSGCAMARGEGSTTYTRNVSHSQVSDTHTASRIARHVPDARLIYIVREPLARIESDWKYEVKMGRIRCTFDRALRKHKYIVDASRYWTQLQRYRQWFCDDQILVLFFEDFVKDTECYLRQCYQFLGVSSEFCPSNLNERQKVSVAMHQPGACLRFVWKSTVLSRLASLVPGPLRTAGTRALSIDVPARIAWSNESRSRLVDELCWDASHILRYAGKPKEFWDSDVLRWW